MQPRIFEKHNQMLTQAVVFSHTLHQVALTAFLILWLVETIFTQVCNQKM